MHKRPLVTAILATLPLFAGTAIAEESPVSANVSLVSDYAYRGISQTDEKPALQGGFDYAHSSGLYVGVWGSNVSWLNDVPTTSNTGNSLELDFYGGYQTELGPVGLDVGVLQYYYPGEYSKTWRAETGLQNPNTTEAYIGLSWEFVSFKYSHAFTRLFGIDDSKGSQYFDLSADYEVMPGTTVSAHYGHQQITGPAKSYSDWKVGVSQDVAGLSVGLYYVDTDADDKSSFDADARYIVSVAKSF